MLPCWPKRGWVGWGAPKGTAALVQPSIDGIGAVSDKAPGALGIRHEADAPGVRAVPEAIDGVGGAGWAGEGDGELGLLHRIKYCTVLEKA